MSERLTRAVTFAAKAHEGQLRKMGKTPYILHPMEVAAIIGTITSDEDVIIAGLLHDTVEDTSVTFTEIEQNFGTRVRDLVFSETEDKLREIPAENTWKRRKVESIRKLENAQEMGVRILWLADKLSNMRSLWRGCRDRGDDVFLAFHQKDKAEHEWYYRTIASHLTPLADTAAYGEYINLIHLTFDKGE